ncbi:MAG: acyl-CoA synthetase [Proteobacteria bacterium]|nr:acyl-CoA synthetase [Pseudomonadota bacterium]
MSGPHPPADIPPAASTQWVQTPERGSATVLAAGVYLATRIGRPLAHRILHLVSAYFFLFGPSARHWSQDYLRRVLGRRARASDRYRQYYAFATTIMDRFYFLQERYDAFEVTSEGQELMIEAHRNGQGALLLGAHLGSFALVSTVGRRQPELKVAMAMYDEQAGPVTTFFRVTQATNAPEVIPLGHLDAMLRIRDCLDAGRFVGMLADRSIADSPSQPVNFLGAPAPFPTGPMRVAAALRRKVIFMTGLYRGGNRYHVVFRELADFSDVSRGDRDAAVRAAIERFAQLLEQYTRSDPYNWFNFYDFWQSAGVAAPR